MGVGTARAAGWSLGGQYALALGARLSDRVSRVAVFAGVPPLQDEGVLQDLNLTDRVLLLESRHVPSLARTTVRALRWHESSTRHERLDERIWGAPDVAVLRGAVGPILAAAVTDGLADVDAVLDEYRAWWAPWGFELADVTVPVRIWQGDADAWVPTAMADRLASGVPGATVTWCPGEGHLLAATRWPEALDWLSRDAG